MAYSKIDIRSKEEQSLMRKSGEISGLVLKKAIQMAKPGLSLASLDKIIEEEFIKLGATPSFKTVTGYKWASCLTVNDEVVHGIPREIVLEKGDVLNIDTGALYQNWHTDCAWSVLVGDDEMSEDEKKAKKRFLIVGEKTLWQAIDQAIDGKRVGDISAAIQNGIERSGYSVVKSLAGHGVGKRPHEEPEIPTFGVAGTGTLLKEGMTIAIEVIYTQGKGEVYEKEDGWTIASSDHSLGGLFEMSVIVGKEKAEVLTAL